MVSPGKIQGQTTPGQVRVRQGKNGFAFAGPVWANMNQPGPARARDQIPVRPA